MPSPLPPPDHAPHGPLPEGGRVRTVTRWGEPVMHHRAAPVTTFDAALRTLAADLVATMYAADGVGLAACQVGEGVALFVFDCPDESGARTAGVVCNPVLTLPEGPRPPASTTTRRAACPSPAASSSWPGPTPPSSPARAWTASRSPSRATACSPGACSTRPTTRWARSSATGSPTKARKKLHKQHDKAADDFPPGLAGRGRRPPDGVAQGSPGPRAWR